MSVGVCVGIGFLEVFFWWLGCVLAAWVFLLVARQSRGCVANAVGLSREMPALLKPHLHILFCFAQIWSATSPLSVVVRLCFWGISVSVLVCSLGFSVRSLEIQWKRFEYVSELSMEPSGVLEESNIGNLDNQ